MAQTYNDYPESAINNAKKAIEWKKKYGNEVKAGTQVGWTRAHQLARKEKLSASTIARMASFARHYKNAEIDPKFKSTPWKDRGYVALLIWGGKSGIEWAKRKMRTIRRKQNESYTAMFEEVSDITPSIYSVVEELDSYMKAYYESESDFYNKFYIYGIDGEDVTNKVSEISHRTGFTLDISDAFSLESLSISPDIRVMFSPSVDKYSKPSMKLIVDGVLEREFSGYMEFADAMDDLLYNYDEICDVCENVASVSNSSISSATSGGVSIPSPIPGQSGTEGGIMTLGFRLGANHPWVAKNKKDAKKKTSSGWTKSMNFSDFKKLANKNRYGVVTYNSPTGETSGDVRGDVSEHIIREGKDEIKVSYQISDNLKKVSRIQKHLIDASQLMTEMTDEIKRLKQSSQKIENPLDEILNSIEEFLDLAIDKMRDEKTDDKSTNVQALMRKVTNKLEDMKDTLMNKE